MKKHNFKTTKGYANHVSKQANIVLDKCGIYGNKEDRKGLMDNILKSIEAKAWLFEIFKNSPYHNGKGQLILPMEIERPVDSDVIYDFARYIDDIAHRYYLTREAVIDGYTYREARSERNSLTKLITAVNYMSISDDDIIIKGKPFSEYRKQYRKLEDVMYKFDMSDDLYYTDCKYINNADKYLYDKAHTIANAIRNCVGKQLENTYDIEKLSEAFPNSQCREGIKITRVVQRCLKELGLYQLAMENEQADYNKMYAKWCDAVSPMKVKKWSVLSINFVDFITMSHGNNWTSCLNTDKAGKFTSGRYNRGFNSKRTLDYALDETTMVFYTIDENYDEDGNGDDWELQPKCTRQLFHFGEGKLVQARLYPQSNTSRGNIYTQYRENVEHLLAEAMGEANLWSAPNKGVIDYDGSVVNIPYGYSCNGDYIDFLDIANHGDEESDFQDEVNYVIFRGSTNRTDNGIPMVVGSTNALCIMCGEEFNEDYTDSIKCYHC